jgi:hypothetical protein
MNRYETSMFRPSFGIGALAMTAITIGLAVVVPANMIPVGPDVLTLSASTAVAPVRTQVAISPARIDVVAVRERKTASTPVRNVQPTRGQAG